MDHQRPRLRRRDLHRVIRRDFDDPSGAMALLTSQRNGLSLRARIAAVKLSAGSIEGLERALQIANRDARDVIAQAEYPAQLESSSPGTPAERQEDFEQYIAWLRR